MNENNEINQETGFVLRSEPTSQAESSSQAGSTPQAGSTSQAGPTSPTEPTSQVGPSSSAEPKPMPLPSQDNIYRFQNIDPQSERKKREKKNDKREKREKKEGSSSFPKVIVSAAVFGVVAALCFFACNAILRAVSGQGGSNSVVSQSSQIPLTTVSAGAITGVTDVSGIVDGVMPSIVAITEKSTQQSYFGQTYSSQGAGSGFIVKQDNDQLLIVTNNHVVAGADEISVRFNDGESVEANVKGTSESNDLAVLTVPLSSLKDSTKSSIKVASLGSSDEAKVGQMVIAIGNALGYGQSVTVGYVSAKDREVTNSDEQTGKQTTQILLQTDAAINPGNSGGALIDTNGNVIGINSSKYMSYGNTTVEGMGYAIPMSDAISVINDLMDRQVLKDEEKGYLGITGRTISEDVSDAYGIPVGVYVASISDTGAAYKAGVKQGDVIVAVNGREVKTINEVQEIVNNTKVGTDVTLKVKRSDDGEYRDREFKVTLESKDTLDGLDEEEDDSSQTTPNYGNGYGSGDGSQVIPWGSIY